MNEQQAADPLPPTMRVALRSLGPPSEMAPYLAGALVLGALALATSLVLFLSVLSTPRLSIEGAVSTAVLLVSATGAAQCARRFRTFFRQDGWLALHRDHIQLVELDGTPRADTLTQTLGITRTNYARRAKGKSHVRPGLSVRCSDRTWLLGTLSPRPPWDDAPRTEELPADDLEADDFAALEAAVRHLSSTRDASIA